MRVQIPAKAKFAPLLNVCVCVWITVCGGPHTVSYNKKIYHSLFVARTWQHFIDLLKRKNPRFTAFLDSNLHTRLAIVTKNELRLAFPSTNLPKKCSLDPSTFYLLIVVTNKQTDKQTDRQKTNAGKNIIPRFRGDKDEIR